MQKELTMDLPGHWEFIGGKVEGDESPNEAVVREAREEIGAKILIQEIMDPFIFRYPHEVAGKLTFS